MKIKNLILLVAALGLAGCEQPTDPAVIRQNNVNVQNPEFVANTPAGQLYRIWIDMGSQHDDRIYFISTNQPITVNKTISTGKTSHNESIVVINGIEYIPKNN